MKKEVVHDFLTCTMILRPDPKDQIGCRVCQLTQTQCDSCCMTAGMRYHVDEIKFYSTWQIIIRFIRNLFTHNYSSKKQLEHVTNNNRG